MIGLVLSFNARRVKGWCGLVLESVVEAIRLLCFFMFLFSRELVG